MSLIVPVHEHVHMYIEHYKEEKRRPALIATCNIFSMYILDIHACICLYKHDHG